MVEPTHAAPAGSASEEPEAPRPPLHRRLFTATTHLLGALFVPDRTVPRAVSEGRYGAALLAVTLAAMFAAAAIGWKLDVTEQVTAELTPPPGGGGNGGARDADEAPSMPTDRDIADEVGKRLALERTMLGVKAVLATPALILLSAIGLWILGRFVGGRPQMRRTMALASHAVLPDAVESVISGVVALRHGRVLPEELEAGLVMGPAGKLIFMVWTIALLMLGFSSAASIRPRSKALIAIVWGYGLYFLILLILSGDGQQPPPPPPGAPR